MADDKPPKNGWLGPPGNTQGLKPLATASRARKGKWIWIETDLTEKQLAKHRRFRKAMAEADKENEWSFEW